MQVSFDPDNVADVERVMILLSRRRPRGGDATPLARFLAACTRVSPGSRVSKVSFYELFIAWCRAEGERPWSTRAVTWGMLERGFAIGKSRFQYWAGIELTRSVADFVDSGGKAPLKTPAGPAG
jgi:DNA primase